MQHDEHNTPNIADAEIRARSGMPLITGMPRSEAALRAQAAERKRLKELGLLEDPTSKEPREVRLLRHRLTEAEAALKAERRAHGRTQDKVYHLRCALTEARSLIQISPNAYRSGVEARQRLAAELAERETELAEFRTEAREAEQVRNIAAPVLQTGQCLLAPQPLEGDEAQDILDRVRDSHAGPKAIEPPLDWEPPSPGGDGKRVPPDREGYTPEDAWHDYKMGD